MMRKYLLTALSLVLFIGAKLQGQTTELVYSLGLAGSTIDIASVATDASDNIFICGSFTGSGVNFNPNGVDSLKNSKGSTDGFIAKYNSLGALQKVITFGNTNVDRANKVYVDGSNNVYMLASVINSGIKFDNVTGFGSNAGSGAMALVKYNNALILQQNRLLMKTGGATGDLINDVKVFGTDVYITGMLANTTVNFNPGGTALNLSTTGGISTDIFVAKYDATLLNQWAYNMGGTDGDGGNGIDLDASGNIYLTGFFRGQGINLNPNGSTLVSEAGGGVAGSGATGDAFVAKYNTAMACQWAFNIGAALFDQGNSILVSQTNSNVYVGGIVKNDALDVYFNPASTTTDNFSGVGLNDIFIASYSSSGSSPTYNWHLATGSTLDDNLAQLSFDAGGNIVCTGFVQGNVDFGNSKTVTGLGGKDAFFGVVAGTSGLTTSVYNLGGSGDEQGNGVAITPTGKILVTGDLSATGDYDPTATTNTLTLKGTQDGFIARYVLCSPPSITKQPADSTKCVGAGVSFAVNASGATSYLWKKGGTAIPGATTATYSIAAVALTDAANYTVDVTNSCQTVTSSIAKLTVNPKPSITSASTSSVCSGTALAYSITSDIASGYNWSRAAVTGISNTAVTGQTTASITETLTNTTTAPIVVAYVITPTSTTGSCAGSSFTLNVTVNPKPSITSSATGAVCSGLAQNYTILSSVASGYNWSRAAVAGITNTAVTNQTTNPIVEILNNNSTTAVNAVYLITPTSTTGSCAGATFTYTVTVNPKPSISSSSTGTICSGIAQSYTISTAVPSSYSWSRAAVTGISNSAVTGQSANPIAEALVNTTTTAQSVAYIITPTSTTGSCAGSSFTYTVTVNPAPSITSLATGTVCSGSPVGYTITSDIASGYSWSRAAVSGISNTAVTGQASNPITESLTNTTGTAQTVAYIITPTSTAGSCAGSPFTYTVTVNPTLTPTVSASASATTICTGASLSFTATSVNPGTSPTYQWKNGATAISGATNSTYTTTTAANGDSYSVVLTSNATCVSSPTAASTPISITVTSTVAPTITATSSATTICAGTSITFSTSSTGGGGAPTYQWKNGSTAISGATNSSYTTTSAANGDSYSVVMTSSSACASPTTATSTPIAITVNAVTTPSVSVTSTATTICAGASLGFTATPTNAGTTPTYQWKKGGTAISGATNATFTTTTAANGDSYTVVVTSTATCPSTPTVTSTPIVITVNPVTTPSVSVTSTATTICAGTSLGFTATPTNAGTTPTYQWKNGATAISGATSATYTTTAAANGDSYSVVVTSTATCPSTPTVTSTPIAITVNAVTTPTVSVTSTATTICAGASLGFTATAANAGTTPMYQWKNGATAISGATNATYTTTTAANGDSYSVVVTSTAACPSTPTVTSTPIAITVNAVTTPTVSVTPTATTICAGTSLGFTATAANAGTTPTYQWKNGATAISGATSATYTTTAAANGDSYSVVVTSTATCPSTPTVTSTPISITVNPVLTPSVSASASATSICPGTSITFTATAANAGTTPTYQWKNGATAISGATSSTYSTTTAANGDSYSVVVTSTAICPSTPTATSSAINITVSSSLTPTVSVTSTATTICAGASLGFTATASSAGTTPTYQWKNGATTISGATNATYTTTTAANGDSYSVVVTSSATCSTTPTVTSTPIAITVNAVTTPTVSVTSTATTICAGTSLGFTATPSNAGTPPTYQWKNGSTVISGATSATYTTTSAANSDSYSVVVTSTAICPSTPTVTSTPITITVNPIIIPAVSATSTATTICAGAGITFTATPTSGGTIPTYQWKNGATAISGATNSTYVTTTAADGDSYSVTMTSNALCASPATLTSNAIVVNVNAVQTPTVTTSASATTICAGATVSFTAVPVNAGTTPTYQWKKGATAISGATSSTYSTTTAADNDSYTVVVTSNAACPATPTVTSTAIVITVNPVLNPSVTISTGSTTICSGSSITLSATPVYGGAPGYQWINNSTPISGATNSTYTTTSASDGDSYSVSMTSTLTCVSAATVNSNAIVMTVNPILTPAVTIAANNTSICTGTSVIFTATPSSGGAAPTYKWKLGASYITGATNASYTTTTASDGDNYTVEMTGNATCVTSSAPVLSNVVTISIVTSAAPTVSITANPGNTVCAGANVLFTSTVGLGGTAPTYQWKNNNVGISGATNATYSTTSLADGDKISLDIVSNSSCASSANATSGQTTITVTPLQTPSISISASAVTICSGSSVVFTSTPSNGGSSPAYRWLNNGNPISGETGSSYTTTSLAAGNSITAELTSNAGCVTTAVVTSSPSSVTVNPIIVPTVSIVADNNVICPGTTVNFTSTVTGGTATYKWKSGSTYIAAATNASYSTSTANDGDIYSLEITNAATCASPATVISNSVAMTVNAVTAITSQPSDQSVCSLGSSATYTVGASGTNLSYQWKGGTTVLVNSSTFAGVGTNALTISNISSAELQSYTVTVTGTCGAVTSGAAALTQSSSPIVINTQPVSQTAQSGNTISLSVLATGPSLTYQWKRGGFAISDDSRISGSATNMLTIINVAVTDNFSDYVCVISSPCATSVSSSNVSVSVTTVTSIQNAQAQGFSVYPNPSAGQFILSNPATPFNVEEIEIVSMQGVVVATKQISNASYINEVIHAQELPSGAYLVIIKGDGQQALLKIVIDK